LHDTAAHPSLCTKGICREQLETKARSSLETAVFACRKGERVYESLRNLNEVIGTQYGNRVLYELIQNAHDAHDAHEPDRQGRILVHLTAETESEGTLIVANGGRGFREKDVDAIRNIGVSAKDVGEGIGNKGLGFRSIEALTDDVHVFSKGNTGQSERFDGYCFRFATAGEIEEMLSADAVEPEIVWEVARTIPRYLVPRPLNGETESVITYARRGYATVVVVPLKSRQAVEMAIEQVREIANLNVPLLLFLERIADVRISLDVAGEKPERRVLRRREGSLGAVPEAPGCRLSEVDVGEGRRFLLVRCQVDKGRVLEAVEASISERVQQLKRWRDWKGEPVVSVAVGLTRGAVTQGRLYNFLPMGEEAEAPLVGYLDAPFFAGIDRRDADLDLPLNETLMEAAAEA